MVQDVYTLSSICVGIMSTMCVVAMAVMHFCKGKEWTCTGRHITCGLEREVLLAYSFTNG